MTAQQPPSRFQSLKVFLLLVFVVVAIQIALWFALDYAYHDLRKQADFGQMFGGINTLFAGLAFAALVVTLMLQQQSFRQQRDELASQAERIRQQAFETMLVQLLGFHHAIARESHLRVLGGEVSGREALGRMSGDLVGILANTARELPKAPPREVIDLGYEKFHQYSQANLDHLFRNLYHIIKFVDASKMEEPRRYTSLVRAQLSAPELILLFYNGLSSYGEKFKPLVEKYALLEHLPTGALADQSHRDFYKPGAYGQNERGPSIEGALDSDEC
jgi:Putative phage abortive infection protein